MSMVMKDSLIAIDLLHEMKPETVFVQLPPDLPVFIKNASEGKGDYRDRWY